jgi:hypothetical protein
MSLIVASVSLVAAAIEPPQPTPAPAVPSSTEKPASEVPAPAAEEKPAQDVAAPAPDSAAVEEEELPPLPPEAASAGPSPQRFNPTEKVRADFPVSFPIDI